MNNLGIICSLSIIYSLNTVFWEKMTIKKQKLDLSLSAMPTFAILPPKIYRNNEYLKMVNSTFQ
jgi:hypothetical protein